MKLLNWNFQRGGGSNKKKTSWGEYRFFRKNTILAYKLSLPEVWLFERHQILDTKQIAVGVSRRYKLIV